MHNPHGIKLFTRLRVGICLRKHELRYNFQDSLDPFCNCFWYIETTIHFFQITQIKEKPFEKISNIEHYLD